MVMRVYTEEVPALRDIAAPEFDVFCLRSGQVVLVLRYRFRQIG